MTVGEVFARAFDLWKKDVGWLIIAGLVVGAIIAALVAVTFGILLAILAGAGLTFASAVNDGSNAVSAAGVGVVVLAFVVYMIALFAIEVVAMVFYGGMYEMVIGAAKESRPVRFGDLFSGFRRFWAFALFALVMWGISLGTNLLGVIPFVGAIIGMVISIWIGVAWLYVLPLIADHGIGFGDAAKRSMGMVKGVGWWKTFLHLLLLGLIIGVAMLVVVLIVILIVAAAAKGSDAAAVAVAIVGGIIAFIVFGILVPPYGICYVGVLYLGSGGAVYPPPYVPSVPPAPGTAYAMPADATVVAPAPPVPPVPPPDATAATQAPATPPDQTAATQLPGAGLPAPHPGAPPAAPEAPQAPDSPHGDAG